MRPETWIDRSERGTGYVWQPSENKADSSGRLAAVVVGCLLLVLGYCFAVVVMGGCA